MATLITNSKFKQFDANGEPLAAGKIYTYIVGTTTNKATYQDEDLTTLNTNPIILDSWGEATIWIDGDTKFYITDSNDVPIRTYASFADGGGGGTATETPVVSSPQGAVLRSSTTDTGYIKIRLPMGEWPNTKMSFDVIVYQDVAGESFKLTLAGFANSAGSQWSTTTSTTNGKLLYDVQYGNDGIYPAIYIGAVDSEWIKPQIAVSNFLAGEFSYDWDTWDNGWSVSITTTLGTITSTDITIGPGWEDWQTPTYEGVWGDTIVSGERGLRYRKSGNKDEVAFSGGVRNGMTSDILVFKLPVGYRPAYNQYLRMTAISSLLIESNGDVSIPGASPSATYTINATMPLT